MQSVKITGLKMGTRPQLLLVLVALVSYGKKCRNVAWLTEETISFLCTKSLKESIFLPAVQSQQQAFQQYWQGPPNNVWNWQPQQQQQQQMPAGAYYPQYQQQPQQQSFDQGPVWQSHWVPIRDFNQVPLPRREMKCKLQRHEKRVVSAQLQPQRQLLPHPRRRLRQPEGGGELREAVLPPAIRPPSSSPAADETQRPIDRRLSVGEPGIRTGRSLGAAAGPAR